MDRARVVTLNAALGPLDYRVPDGMDVEPGSIVVAPLGPRQLLGVAWEAERLPTNEVPDARLRPLAGVLDVPPIAAPLAAAVRVDRRLLSRPARLGPADGPARRRRRSRTAAAHRISAHWPCSRAADSAAREGARRARRTAGHDPRARSTMPRSATALLRGLVNAGALEAVAVDADRRLARPDPDHARPMLNDDQREAAASLASAIGKGFDPVLLDGVTGSGKTEVYFEAIAKCLRQGEAGARPASGDRADRALPEALRGALRLRARRLALGSALVPAPARLARDRERRGGGDRRCALGPVSALPQARPDRRRRGARAELQAGRRSPVSRPRYRGHARQVRGHSGNPLDGHAADRKPAHGRARPLSRGQSCRSVSPAPPCPRSARST